MLHSDTNYMKWLEELKDRYLRQRLRAMSAVNKNVLEFYWNLGRDITAKQYANTYGSGFYKNLSDDLKRKLPGVKGFSQINLRYMTAFYALYSPIVEKVPQVAEDFSKEMLFSIPWDHHRRIIDKCKDKTTLWRNMHWMLTNSLWACRNMSFQNLYQKTSRPHCRLLMK